MHLYDALRALAAADLKASLENGKFSRVLAAAQQLEAVVSLPPGAAKAATAPSLPNFPNPDIDGTQSDTSAPQSGALWLY
jgi:hypothetical protein